MLLPPDNTTNAYKTWGQVKLGHLLTVLVLASLILLYNLCMKFECKQVGARVYSFYASSVIFG